MRGRRGQATLLVVAVSGLVLVGAMGLAIDAAQLYGHTQMAQYAADAAAESAAYSLMAGTNVGTNAFGSGSFNCTIATDVRTPCAYARLNGFGATGTVDTVAVDFPGSVAGVTLTTDPTISTKAVRVIITRPVANTFMAMIAGRKTTTIKAVAIAGIVQTSNPVPIVVTHPSLTDALSMGGNTLIQICGGPQRSIQVNSVSATAVSIGGSVTVDLSKAGPSDTGGNCTSGTGTDFSNFGGPTSISTSTGVCGTFHGICIGSTGNYLEPSGPILDPLASILEPCTPGTSAATCGATGPNNSWPDNGSVTSGPLTVGGTGDCPSGQTCSLYYPGVYANGIHVKNTYAIFYPGLYYISGAPSSGPFAGDGFGNYSLGQMHGCSTTCTNTTYIPAADQDTTSNCCGSNGMMVYLGPSAGILNVGANSSAGPLVGADTGSYYKGLLFFVSRSSSAHTGNGAHKLGGGGALSLTGTIYATNTNMTSSLYQEIKLQGNSGNSTLISGEIITSVLTMGGGGTIQMDLNPNVVFPIDQVALIK